ncbi:MAG: hypothetical protein JWQ87_4818 [Candidatus Sulfotelmatobacter sp.]|nr:hypothetical protein [Candidatus Sulfotelmatobacter sp.]
MRIKTWTVKVTNISEKISPKNLRSLFGWIGTVYRVEISSNGAETSALLVVAAYEAEEAISFWKGRTWKGLRIRMHKADTGWFDDGED